MVVTAPDAHSGLCCPRPPFLPQPVPEEGLLMQMRPRPVPAPPLPEPWCWALPLSRQRRINVCFIPWGLERKHLRHKTKDLCPGTLPGLRGHRC